MGDPTTYHFNLDPALRPVHAPLEERWWPGIRDAAIEASSARIYDAILGVRAVVIHATAGGSSASAASVIVGRKASFHWLVPDEDEPQHGQFVWATCHEARAAWHVRNACSHPAIWDGRRRINHWSLGIEVVNRQVRTDAFSDWQVEATAQIVRYAWAKYPNLRHVVSHAMLDPARRSDPGSLFPWERFRAAVLDGREDRTPKLVAGAAELEAVLPSAPFCMVV
ncbi:N-acetylmuramoyl-L-alanine amidase [Citromicrobium bathyomarinum]|uniref:N-acetylmuramoyl-L-alanine amidase n=1 Tax=Citromicrobium bathyomarinum TaxID=72174 RepID=UPI00315ACDD4